MNCISRKGRTTAAIVAAIGWAALATQVPLTLAEAARVGNPAWVGLINLFSYFTILTNAMVALSATMIASGRAGGLAAPGARAALVLYIIIVGLIYQTLLRGLVEMSGLRLVTDTVFHAIIPVLWPLWWLAFGRTNPSLPWTTAIDWLGFPLAYGLYSIARGTLIDRWPYPFMNASTLGYPQVAINLAGLLVLFLALGLSLIALDRRLPRRLAFG